MNYYKQGDAAKAEQIKAAFEKLGYDTSFVQKLSASDRHILFTLPCDTRVHAFHTAYIETDILKRLVNIDPEYKELELPKPHYDISNFHAGMPVLVRSDNDCSWDYSVFSRNTGNEYWPFAVCNGVSFTQCIPFESNEHLLGTTDMPSEEYINW